MTPFVYEQTPAEAVYRIQGGAAPEVLRALFKQAIAAGQLVYAAWVPNGPLVAVTWWPPDRLEVRVPAVANGPAEFERRLAEIGGRPASGAPATRLDRLIARLEQGSYTDADEAIEAQEIAAEIDALATDATTRAAREALRAARDALDDGLPAEAVTAALYRARRQSVGG